MNGTMTKTAKGMRRSRSCVVRLNLMIISIQSMHEYPLYSPAFVHVESKYHHAIVSIASDRRS